jgi:DNA-binding beta-propeller fold protein YncE
MTRRLTAPLWLGALVLAVGLIFASCASAEVLWGNQQLSSFGSGGAIGGFADYPAAVVSPSTGDLYVADTGNHRVEVFSSAGKFIAAWGWGTNGASAYQICTSSCEIPISGSGLGQFEAPIGITIDPLTGDVYVVDSALGRIDQFSASGKPIRYFGKPGSGKGQIENPAGGFAFDAATNQLLLADSGNNRIDVFTPSGASAGSLGSLGTGDGQFDVPIGVAAAPDGDLYVTDDSNSRVEQFSRSKAFIAAWGLGVKDGELKAEICTNNCLAGISSDSPGGFNGDGGIAVDPTDGSVYVANYRTGLVERLSASGAYQSEFSSLYPNLLALDPQDGDLYITSASTILKYGAGGGFLATFGSTGAKAGQYANPHGVAVNPKNGDLYVADYNNHRLDVFSGAGKFLAAWGWGVKDGDAKSEVCTSSCEAGIAGSGYGQLDGPLGVAVDPTTGDVFVSDYLADQLMEFSSSGSPISVIGREGTVAGTFNEPEGLAYDPSLNEVLVADTGNNRIDIIDFVAGTSTAAFGWGVNGTSGQLDTCDLSGGCAAGQSGTGDGEFHHPSGVAVAPNGTIYVADPDNNRVQVFTLSTDLPTTASFDAAWGSGVSDGTAGAEVCTSACRFGLAGTGPGEFNDPQEIAIDPKTNDVYVADYNNGRIEQLTSAGDYISDFGTVGTGDGQFTVGPEALALAPSGTLYAAEYQGSRLDEFGQPAKPTCAAHTVSVRDSKTIEIRFSCHTPSGITPLYALQSKPRRGTLSAFNATAATVSYKAPRNYAGTVSFRIGATDDSGTNTATIKIKVVRPRKKRRH